MDADENGTVEHGTVDLMGERFSIVRMRGEAAVRASGFSSPSALAYAAFGRDAELMGAREMDPDDPALAAVRAYDDGDPSSLAGIAVQQGGTDLRRLMWRAVRQVEAGTLASYGDVATIAGHPRASRAAASACGACLPSLFVPVHRIVRSTGALAGHPADIEVRRALIEHERAMGMGAQA